MKSINKLKEIDIKNHTCYYFDNIMTVKVIDLRDILLNEKLYENILKYYFILNIMDVKPLCIRFNKVYEVI